MDRRKVTLIFAVGQAIKGRGPRRRAARNLPRPVFEDVSTARMASALAGDSNPDSNERRKLIRNKRGVFKWLPVLFCSDIVHGSWWYVAGSFLATISPIVPIASIYSQYVNFDDSTAAAAFRSSITWILLSLSGLFYTIGSVIFCRAFNEPHLEPLLKDTTHFKTDELLAAWIFLVASFPTIPYAVYYLAYAPTNIINVGLLVAAIIFVICSGVFVYTCYPRKHKKHDAPPNKILKSIQKVIGTKFQLINKHLANDWLVCCWAFLISSLIGVIGSIYYLVYASNALQIFVWLVSAVDCILFFFGSAYLCAGSYPALSQGSVSPIEAIVEIGNGDSQHRNSALIAPPMISTPSSSFPSSDPDAVIGTHAQSYVAIAESSAQARNDVGSVTSRGVVLTADSFHDDPDQEDEDDEGDEEDGEGEVNVQRIDDIEGSAGWSDDDDADDDEQNDVSIRHATAVSSKV